ncbi:cold-shock protein [Zhengella sp. ZM62]|uniref:cold-shock protein n=1 Tax=Zhengella sedimenti TaxID=3390035 RepID=UPI003976B827
MDTGVVRTYDGRKGLGAIKPDDGGKDIMVDIKALDRAGLGGLVTGQAILFDIETDHFGRAHAVNLVIAKQGQA